MDFGARWETILRMKIFGLASANARPFAIGILLVACLAAVLSVSPSCWGAAVTSDIQHPQPAPSGCADGNGSVSRRPHYRLDRSEEDWSALCNRAASADFWDPAKYIRVGKSESFLSFGGELRSTYEMYQQYNWGSGPQDDNGYSLNRLMGHADAHLGNHVRVFAELQSGLPFGRNGGPRPVVDRDELDVSQLFFELRLSNQTTHFAIRAGRQELNYGDRTLVSTRELNVRRPFDGINLRARSDRWTVDAFAVRPVKTQQGILDDASDANQTFWGIWASRTKSLPTPLAQLDVYCLGLSRRSARYDQGTDVERRYTLGFNLNEVAGAWSFGQEADLQLGTFGSDNLVAWKVAQEVTYSISETRLHPVFSIQAAVSSGDTNQADPRLQTFYPLFPKGVYYGYMLFTSGSLNTVVVHPGVSLQLSPTVSVTGEWFAFWRTSAEDGLYSQSGALLRGGQTTGSGYVGAESDIGVTWHVDSHTTLQFLAAYYDVGSYLRQINPPGKDAAYFSATAAYKF